MEDNTLILHQTVQAIAGVIYFMPLVLVLLSKKLQTTFFILFAAYWTWGGLVNLLVWTSVIDSDRFIIGLETCYNMMDAPLLLFILYYTTPYKVVKKSIGILLVAFVACVLSVVLITGLSPIAERGIAASGVVVVLATLCWVIYYTHFKTGKIYSLLSSRQFIYYALLFGCGCAIITFVLNYLYKPGTAKGPDIFLIYHVSIIFTTAIASYGYITYKEEATSKLRHMKGYKEDAGFKYL